MPKAMLSDGTGDGMSIIPAMRISSPQIHATGTANSIDAHRSSPSRFPHSGGVAIMLDAFAVASCLGNGHARHDAQIEILAAIAQSGKEQRIKSLGYALTGHACLPCSSSS